MAWIAYIFAMMAIIFSASRSEVSDLESRVSAIETRKCALMEVRTPTGTSTICVTALHRSPSPEPER